ncbi:hypothetical protein FHG87_008911 [Trinorchestia longiramus]|nr:hypothetical protein FHG87_008911 [Trinorchestia longiramus]
MREFVPSALCLFLSHAELDLPPERLQVVESIDVVECIPVVRLAQHRRFRTLLTKRVPLSKSPHRRHLG